MGTPGMENFTITYTDPEEIWLGEGEADWIADNMLRVTKIDTETRTIDVELLDEDENVVETHTFGPITEDAVDLLPQYAPSQDLIQ